MPAVWTAPRTWVDGETPTAAIFNTHIRDNAEFLKQAFDGVGRIPALTAQYLADLSATSLEGIPLLGGGNAWTARNRFDLGNGRMVIPVGSAKYSNGGRIGLWYPIAGYIYVSGTAFVYTDALQELHVNQQPPFPSPSGSPSVRSVVGTLLDHPSPEALPGSIYLGSSTLGDPQFFYYIDANGDRRSISGSSVSGSGLPGSIWIEGTQFHWRSQVGERYVVGS